MAKEHGMIDHKGKEIPAEVKSLADRIRKKRPGKSDEYVYRTAWDIYRSYTAEGKKYPHKSPESGLKREGGGTGPLSKSASDNEGIWESIVKQANLLTAGKNLVAKAKGAANPRHLGATTPIHPPTGGTLNYAEMRAAEIAKKRAQPGGTLTYSKGQPPVYTAPGKTMEQSAEAAKAKMQEQSQKRLSHALKGGHTDPQIRRQM